MDIDSYRVSAYLNTLLDIVDAEERSLFIIEMVKKYPVSFIIKTIKEDFEPLENLIAEFLKYEPIMYLFINKNLEMSSGKLAVQSARVSEILTFYERDSTDSLFKKSFNELEKIRDYYGNKIVSVKLSQKDFNKIASTEFNTEYKVRFYKTYDSGLTEVPEQSLTVMMCTPILKMDIPKSFKRLQLY